MLSPICVVFSQAFDRSTPEAPEIVLSTTRGEDGTDALDKLAPELLALYDRFSTTTRGENDESGLSGFTSSQLVEIFGLPPREANPLVTVSIRSSGVIEAEVLKLASATVIARVGDIVYAMVPIKRVREIASSSAVREVGVLKSWSVPSPLGLSAFEIKPVERGNAVTSPRLANEFDKQQLTGRNVLIGVIDSGIDWSHDDFRKGDGTSRIYAIWDLMDDSYQLSGGKIGSKPPVYLQSSQKWLGTIYTNAQINAALTGNGTVNTVDKYGHGTAVAGTAASNGRASGNGIPSGTYDGVAPDAELIIVRAMDCGSFSPVATITAEWIMSTAKSLKRPVVVNMSYGGHFSSHDGSEETEVFIDSLVGPGKPGAVITVAAGNDGRYNIRANGRFAAKRKGQADQFSDPIDLNVKSPVEVIGVFDKQDDWGLALRSSNPIFEGTDGKPAPVFIYRNNKSVECESTAALKNQAQFAQFCGSIRLEIAEPTSQSDKLQIRFPTGSYIIWGFGTGTTVKNGAFDLYLAERASKASFGMGTQKTGIVSTPGNARNALTIGSFDFRNSWLNQNGELTLYNLLIGGPSAYSSSGFRRDGLVKPDILAPARYTISPLSKHAKQASGGCVNSMATGDQAQFTKDGYHVAWEGTSAATPFVTGVIALMLQKNPTLDAEQVRSILKKSARSGGTIGPVPNPVWGWGMIDPAAALRMTPMPRRR